MEGAPWSVPVRASGATRIRQIHDWWIMQDPAELLFCVVPDRAERLTDDNALRWE
jgi:hypothetical protein